MWCCNGKRLQFGGRDLKRKRKKKRRGTEQAYPNINASFSYSGGVLFKSRPGHRLSELFCVRMRSGERQVGQQRFNGHCRRKGGEVEERELGGWKSKECSRREKSQCAVNRNTGYQTKTCYERRTSLKTVFRKKLCILVMYVFLRVWVIICSKEAYGFKRGAQKTDSLFEDNNYVENVGISTEVNYSVCILR